MHVHVIDNNSVHLALIAKLVVDCFSQLKTITFADTYAQHDGYLKTADLVIISGGRRLVHLNPGTHRRIIRRLVESKKPIFGICLGAEALASYFGAAIVALPEHVSGPQEITLKDATMLPHLASRTVKVYQHHRWAIQSPPPELTVFAESPTGVELFKHKDLPIWGTQFHPEVRRGRTKGYLLFASALQSLEFELRAHYHFSKMLS